MIGVFVTFDSDSDFDPSVIAKIAAEARQMFEGMPSLRNKFFKLDEKRDEFLCMGVGNRGS